MTLLDTVFELIDLRSFGNIWFWLVVAAAWSGASQRVLGVPWDMATRARRSGEGSEAMADLEEMVRINTGRILGMAEQSGLLLAGLAAFGLTSLALLGFVYGSAFSQAVFLLGFPLTLVQVLSLRTARRIRARARRARRSSRGWRGIASRCRGSPWSRSLSPPCGACCTT